MAEQLAWDAEHAPENVGFSHNVEARIGRRGERVVVEAITRVQSVDLVADPATTRGLFESAADGRAMRTASLADGSRLLTLDDLQRDHPELVESIRREQADEFLRLQEEVDRLTALEATEQKRTCARRLLREFDLPDVDATEPWAKTDRQRAVLRIALAAADEPAMRALVEERARLVRTLAGDGAPAAPIRGCSRGTNIWCKPPAR